VIRSYGEATQRGTTITTPYDTLALVGYQQLSHIGAAIMAPSTTLALVAAPPAAQGTGSDTMTAPASQQRTGCAANFQLKLSNYGINIEIQSPPHLIQSHHLYDDDLKI
jgi:hypothetical protein